MGLVRGILGVWIIAHISTTRGMGLIMGGGLVRGGK